jgi:hypothetical protein
MKKINACYTAIYKPPFMEINKGYLEGTNMTGKCRLTHLVVVKGQTCTTSPGSCSLPPCSWEAWASFY